MEFQYTLTVTVFHSSPFPCFSCPCSHANKSFFSPFFSISSIEVGVYEICQRLVVLRLIGNFQYFFILLAVRVLNKENMSIVRAFGSSLKGYKWNECSAYFNMDTTPKLLIISPRSFQALFKVAATFLSGEHAWIEELRYFRCQSQFWETNTRYSDHGGRDMPRNYI